MVPPAGCGIPRARTTSVVTRSWHVAAWRYMRLGYVCAGAEANQRSHEGKVSASDQ